MKSEELYAALRRKALGETLYETQEEYVYEDGETVLKKRKVVTKQTAPDLAAMRFLLESGSEDLSSLTDAELLALQKELETACLVKENSACLEQEEEELSCRKQEEAED